MALEPGITHITDSGPACLQCGGDLWGYAPVRPSVFSVRPAYHPQCASCHDSESILPVPNDDGDVRTIRAAHVLRSDSLAPEVLPDDSDLWHGGCAPEGFRARCGLPSYSNNPTPTEEN